VRKLVRGSVELVDCTMRNNGTGVTIDDLLEQSVGLPQHGTGPPADWNSEGKNSKIIGIPQEKINVGVDRESESESD